MSIYVMRHGQAEMFARSDELRPLTSNGREQASQVATYLQQSGIAIEQILVSPYHRTQQTAAIINEVFPVDCSVSDDLVPSADVMQAEMFIETFRDKNVLVVSHMPLVHLLVKQFTGIELSEFSTASVAKIDCGEAFVGNGTLAWFRSPHQMRG